MSSSRGLVGLQKLSIPGPRSKQVVPVLQRLYAHVGVPHCSAAHEPVREELQTDHVRDEERRVGGEQSKPAVAPINLDEPINLCFRREEYTCSRQFTCISTQDKAATLVHVRHDSGFHSFSMLTKENEFTYELKLNSILVEKSP